MAMNFEELDGETRAHMLDRFDAEQSSANPYMSAALSGIGLAVFPDLMREAITDGTEITLFRALSDPQLWNPTEEYVLKGVRRERRRNLNQAAERLSLTEFNTWYVAGLANRLLHEGQTECQVYRAAEPRWQHASCDIHDGLTYPIRDIVAGHRVGYWPPPGIDGVLSIPAGPGCHHTIRRLPGRS